jgi:VIT1/CCC1 family predicted Fe2+/Mn2+ transporter
MKDVYNREILESISAEELNHYDFWKKYSHKDIKPQKVVLWKYYLIATIFGLTFGIKLMERGEGLAQKLYEQLSKVIPDLNWILKQEEEHEQKVIKMINEERLHYIGSVVLGLNDALVELTGALAGLTFALQNTRLIAITGLITGISAALSMAVSSYLAAKSESGEEKQGKAAIYTGIAYILTILVLISPYFLFTNYFMCLTLINAIIIIFIFNYYISIVKGFYFKRRFLEMALISLGVAGFSFAIGFLLKILIGV